MMFLKIIVIGMTLNLLSAIYLMYKSNRDTDALAVMIVVMFGFIPYFLTGFLLAAWVMDLRKAKKWRW